MILQHLELVVRVLLLRGTGELVLCRRVSPGAAPKRTALYDRKANQEVGDCQDGGTSAGAWS